MCVCQASVTPLTGLSRVTIETDGDVAYQGGGKEGVRSGAWGKVGDTVSHLKMRGASCSFMYSKRFKRPDI